jgi:K+-transporting ATPase ATPase A chain
MSANGWLQFAFYCLVLLLTVRPVGIYLARVLEGERTWLDPVLRPFERLIYKLCAINAVCVRHVGLFRGIPAPHLWH